MKSMVGEVETTEVVSYESESVSAQLLRLGAERKRRGAALNLTRANHVGQAQII